MLFNILRTVRGVPFLARQTSTTDSSFPSRVPTLTKPSGLGDNAAQTTSSVFDIGQGGLDVPSGLKIKPYGRANNNDTFSLRVIGWQFVQNQGVATTAFWDPTVLVELACTLTSSVTGVAGGLLTASDLFADTLSITNTTANQGTDINVVSNANNLAAHATLDFLGYEMLEVIFTTGGVATSCNALLAWI